MSVALRHNESFYDRLFEQFTELFEIFTNIFMFIAATGFIVFIACILYCIYGRYILKLRTFSNVSKSLLLKISLLKKNNDIFTISILRYRIRIAEHRCKRSTNELTYDLLELQKIKDYHRLCIRQQSIISHKEMLKTLEHTANECYKMSYALKCIDIVVHCPQLLNTKSPPNGLTPFHRVCLRGNKSLISFMLAKGADPTIATVTGENALCMAIYYFLNNPTEDDFSCLETLVGNGCTFGSTDKCYDRFLKMALSINHTKLVRWLILHRDISTNKILRFSSTPLI